MFKIAGQFGSPGFSGGIFIAFFIATLLSITESMADYFACARISHLPPPPLTAINRGIMIEGLWSMIAGFFGAAHATTTYSNNIGLIGMTGVRTAILKTPLIYKTCITHQLI